MKFKRILRSRVLLILSIFVIAIIIKCSSITGIMSNDGSIEERDFTKDIVPVANSLAEYQPQPKWETKLLADEKDLIELVGEKYLLVGTIELSMDIGEPKYSDIYLFDRTTGKKLWQAPREPLERGAYSLLATQPLIVLRGLGIEKSYYSGITLDSGIVRWEYKIEGNHRACYDENSNSLVIVEQNDETFLISVLNVYTGELLWSQKIIGSGKAKLSEQSIIIQDNYIFIATDRVAKFEKKNGKIIWSSLFPEDTESISIVNHISGILSWTDHNIKLINKNNGEKIWGPVKIEHIVASIYASTDLKESVFVIGLQYVETNIKSLNNKKYSYYNKYLYCINMANGNIIWDIDPQTIGIDPKFIAKNTMESSLLYDTKQLYFTTPDMLYSVDATDGKLALAIDLPEHGFSSLNDILLSRSDLIIIVKEHAGVAAFSKSQKKFIWSEKCEPPIYFSPYWYATAKGVLNNYELESETSDQQLKNEISWWTGWTNTVNNQWSGYTGDYSKMGSFGFSMSLFQSSLAFSSILKAEILAYVMNGLVKRLCLWVANSAEIHFKSIQGNYYVRSYEKRGEGVMIVDLRTGERMDFEYSAPNRGMKQFTMRLPDFVLDSEKGELFTTGISLNTDSYQKYVKMTYGMPYPVVQSFSLSNLKLKKDEPNFVYDAGKGEYEKIISYLEEGISIDSRTTSGETALMRASKLGLKETVELLIERGADLEATDNSEETALFYAADKDQIDILKLLIQSGANVNAKNLFGNTALDNEISWGKNENVIKILKEAGTEYKTNSR